MYVQGSLIDFQAAILEPRWPQYDHPAACVITQQYSATLVSWPFHSCKEKFGMRFRIVTISIYHQSVLFADKCTKLYKT